MARDTKQQILDEALVMFAQRGYEGTNMRKLAARFAEAAKEPGQC